MGVTERRERERQAVRQEILDAARALFLEEGYERTSMREVAQRIEYSPTTIYLYFHDKRELLESICAETFSKFVKSLQEIGQANEDPLENLRATIRAYVEFGLKNPNDYWVTFMMGDQQKAHIQYFQPDHPGTNAFMYLVGVVAECVRRKKIRNVDPNVTAQALWAASHGLTSLLLAKPDFPWAPKDDLINSLGDALIEGLKPA
jgi:AcrR family transcriptional regulator